MATVSPDMPYAFGMFEGIVIGIGISIAVLMIAAAVEWARGR